MHGPLRVENRPASEDREDCRRLRPDEIDPIGNPLDPITIEPVAHPDQSGHYWIAYASTLPGYCGEGETPMVALARLHALYARKPIFRMKIRRYTPKTLNAWIERWVSLNIAVAKMRNKSSVSTDILAKEYSLGKNTLLSRYNIVARNAQRLIKEGVFKETELPVVIDALTGNACPETAAMAIRHHWRNVPKHRVIRVWAMERFHGLDGR